MTEGRCGNRGCSGWSWCIGSLAGFLAGWPWRLVVRTNCRALKLTKRVDSDELTLLDMMSRMLFVVRSDF